MTTVNMNVRVDPALKERLKERARLQDRTLSQQVNRYLRMAMIMEVNDWTWKEATQLKREVIDESD